MPKTHHLFVVTQWFLNAGMLFSLFLMAVLTLALGVCVLAGAGLVHLPIPAEDLDLGGVDELRDLHGVLGGDSEFGELFGLDGDVLAFAVLVAFDDLTALHHALVVRAPELLLDAGVVVAVQHVKRDVTTAGAGEQSNRH